MTKRTHPGPTVEQMAKLLEQHEDYKVLRRLKEPWLPNELDSDALEGLYVDCESTGLDADKAEVVELAMVPFRFTQDGLLSPGGDVYHSYREPSIPIEEDAAATHGLTMEKLKGHRIDMVHVDRLVDGAKIVIAHNASYDRRMLERLTPSFSKVCWGCSMSEIPWPSKSRKLEHILMTMGWFYDAHGAVADCLAGVYALQQIIQEQTALKHLLTSARQTGYHVWAIDAPYAAKDALKGRKYFWNGGEDGRPKAWNKEVKESEIDEERAWLAGKVYKRTTNAAQFNRVTAFNRYSKWAGVRV